MIALADNVRLAQVRGASLIAAALVFTTALQGCVAAVPVGAAALAGRKALTDRSAKRDRTEAEAQARADAEAQAKAQAAIIAAEAAKPKVVPPAMQYLYGSGEAAALSIQAYNGLVLRIRASADYRQLNFPVASLVLAPGSTLESPSFVPCGQKPLAIILDIDETALLNLGYEENDARHGLSYDDQRWLRWEATGTGAVQAAPGALAAASAARRANVTLVFISNRSTLNSEATARLLEEAGFDRPIAGQTLLLREEGAGSGKDERRQQVAGRFCVIGLVGDQLGDFGDVFNAPGLPIAARRAAPTNDQYGALWGAGWYLLPNPVYGTAVKGGFDDVFPLDKRWEDPAGQGAK